MNDSRRRGADAVTAAVIRGYLESTCREMGIALTSNAASPIFVEGQDFSCAILDPERHLVAAANFDPSHLCAVEYAVDCAMLELGRATVRPGDVVVTNDPFQGGGHLPDVTMFAPVEAQGTLLGYCVTRAHHIDIGGMSAGSVPSGARDVFGEGLRIVPTKWAEGGHEVESTVDLILGNVRMPDAVLSDFRAQVSSLVVGAERVGHVARRYGAPTLLAALASIQDLAEAQMREFLSSIPDGHYRFREYMDNDGIHERHYAVVVDVTVSGDRAEVDFSGSSAQAEGPINMPYAMTASAVFNAFLQLGGSELTFNHGSFRPISLRAPRGSIVNAQPPAAVFGCTTDTPLRIIDAIGGALSDAAPKRVIAGSYGTCNYLSGAGEDADGRPFMFQMFFEGGWGAGAERDGLNAAPNQSANFRDYPAEILESVYPLRVEQVSLRHGSGGVGKHRGGMGSVRDITFLAPTVLSGFADRHDLQPFGLAGGGPGRANAFLFRRAGSADFVGIEQVFGCHPTKFSGVRAEVGDTIRIQTGGGGGFGKADEQASVGLAADGGEGRVGARAGQLEAASGYDSGVTALSIEAESSRVWPAAGEDRFAPQILEALRSVRGDTCIVSCPLKANPVDCPYYRGETLQFWPRANLARWTARHCPLAERLIPLVNAL